MSSSASRSGSAARNPGNFNQLILSTSEQDCCSWTTIQSLRWKTLKRFYNTTTPCFLALLVILLSEKVLVTQPNDFHAICTHAKVIYQVADRSIHSNIIQQMHDKNHDKTIKPWKSSDDISQSWVSLRGALWCGTRQRRWRGRVRRWAGVSPNAKNKDLLMNKKSKKLFYFTLLYQPRSVDFSISFKIDINCVINMRDSQREAQASTTRLKRRFKF